MRISNSLSAIVLGAALIAGGSFAAASFAGEFRGDGGERQWLSIREVADRLDAAGYRHIEKIEREGGSYEVRATDREGRRAKLYVNPQTGDITERRSESRRRDAGDDRRNAADCNERRCRDDLPAKPAAPTAK